VKKYNYILTHGLFWLFFFLSRWLLIDQNYWASDPDPDLYFIKLLGYYGLDCMHFYTLYFVILPKLLFAKRFLLFTISTLGLGLFVFHFESAIWSGFDLNEFLYPKFIYPLDQVYDIALLTFLSIGIFLWDKWGSLDARREMLEHEVKDSELKFLKSQLSPHFLFNTLNTIYGLSIYDKPNTSKAIHELKTTLNYIEKYNSKEGVTLGAEIENLQSYIAINNLRFDNNVNFSISVENPDLKVEPILFLPFVENAFKHGDNQKGSEIVIELEQKKGYLKFRIINQFTDGKRKDSVSGVGVENVQKRLRILYPDAKIAIKNSGGFFNVFIHLKGLSK
tara:strand:+ start:897 stop:1901 length:1005 start_codon:yes stop_codon:yes gene_type:complete